MRWWIVPVVLGGCDVAFRIDQIDPPSGDATSAVKDGSDPTVPACRPMRGAVVGYYPVDGDGDSDTLTDHGPSGIHGVTVGGPLTVTTGPAECGQGLQILANREITVPYSAMYQLAEGSIDLWVRPIVMNVGLSRVIVARDAGGNNRGDLTLFEHRPASGEYIFVVRLQSGDTGNSGGGTIRCSNGSLVPSAGWYHVAINFGPPELELYVDGVKQTRSSAITINGDNMTCGQSTGGQSAIVGIDGADPKPWFIGYGDVYEAQTLQRVYLSSGGIDNLRISQQRF